MGRMVFNKTLLLHTRVLKLM